MIGFLFIGITYVLVTDLMKRADWLWVTNGNFDRHGSPSFTSFLGYGGCQSLEGELHREVI